MTVTITAFNADDTVTLSHQAGADVHTNTVALAAIPYNTDRVGGLDPSALVVTCPTCGAVSIHPASGGADPDMVQALHVLRRTVGTGKRGVGAAIAEVKQLTETDNGRYRVQGATAAAVRASKPVERQALEDKRGKPGERPPKAPDRVPPGQVKQ